MIQRPKMVDSVIFADSGTGHSDKIDLSPFFKLMADKKASDLFISPQAPIKVKVEGLIYPTSQKIIAPEMVRQIAYGLMTKEQAAQFEADLEVDFSYSVHDIGRFRVSVFFQRGFPAIVLRYITQEMPRLDQLRLPDTLRDLSCLKRGLILMVGSTGSGKSTTLAAMINHRNETASDHIITIEDPIEFLHSNKKSIVNQREVGSDTHSYARALRGAMRAAPDVVMIGEVRDKETMDAAITLAGTGHLCLATLHANNAGETLDRIINLYPVAQHGQVFLDLSQYLRAIIAQRLVRSIDQCRVAAIEMLLNTPHMQDIIKKGDVVAIKEALRRSTERGLQDFDTALHALVKSGVISMEEALANADSRSNLETRINFG